MYILCYTDKRGENIWETIEDEYGMNTRVDELAQELCCDVNDIMVFHTDDMYI